MFAVQVTDNSPVPANRNTGSLADNRRPTYDHDEFLAARRFRRHIQLPVVCYWRYGSLQMDSHLGHAASWTLAFSRRLHCRHLHWLWCLHYHRPGYRQHIAHGTIRHARTYG